MLVSESVMEGSNVFFGCSIAFVLGSHFHNYWTKSRTNVLLEVRISG